MGALLDVHPFLEPAGLGKERHSWSCCVLFSPSVLALGDPAYSVILGENLSVSNGKKKSDDHLGVNIPISLYPYPLFSQDNCARCPGLICAFGTCR